MSEPRTARIDLQHVREEPLHYLCEGHRLFRAGRPPFADESAARVAYAAIRPALRPWYRSRTGFDPAFEVAHGKAHRPTDEERLPHIRTAPALQDYREFLRELRTSAL